MRQPTPRPTPELLAEASYLLGTLARPYKPTKDEIQKVNSWLDDFLVWSEDHTRARKAAPAEVMPAVPARLNGKCAWCTDPMPVPARQQGGGRTKRFCSAACKQAHHRWTQDPQRFPDAQAWTLAHNGLYASRKK